MGHQETSLDDMHALDIFQQFSLRVKVGGRRFREASRCVVTVGELGVSAGWVAQAVEAGQLRAWKESGFAWVPRGPCHGGI